ncbi:MAG: hypothetical protein NZ928_03975 [Endomicrobia bacterium]|nr:hypothetical protein [Endomicrobiia bacterium]MDW8056139.1 hypothetical protein [Elusimicrobiota bacterium]
MIMNYIRKLQSFIQNNKEYICNINEEDTACILIEELIRTLGWNTENLSEVKRRYPNGLINAKSIRSRIEMEQNDTLGDYILIHNEYKIVIEVKPLSKSQLWGNQFHFKKLLNNNSCKCSTCRAVRQQILKLLDLCIKECSVKYFVWTTGDTIIIWEIDKNLTSEKVFKNKSENRIFVNFYKCMKCVRKCKKCNIQRIEELLSKK